MNTHGRFDQMLDMGIEHPVEDLVFCMIDWLRDNQTDDMRKAFALMIAGMELEFTRKQIMDGDKLMSPDHMRTVACEAALLHVGVTTKLINAFREALQRPAKSIPIHKQN